MNRVAERIFQRPLMQGKPRHHYKLNDEAKLAIA